jgi:hypothetical protein
LKPWSQSSGVLRVILSEEICLLFCDVQSHLSADELYANA